MTQVYTEDLAHPQLSPWQRVPSVLCKQATASMLKVQQSYPSGCEKRKKETEEEEKRKQDSSE